MQKHPGKHHEQLPTSFPARGIVNDDLLQRNSHSVPVRSSQKLRNDLHHTCPLLECVLNIQMIESNESCLQRPVSWDSNLNLRLATSSVPATDHSSSSSVESTASCGSPDLTLSVSDLKSKWSFDDALWRWRVQLSDIRRNQTLCCSFLAQCGEPPILIAARVQGLTLLPPGCHATRIDTICQPTPSTNRGFDTSALGVAGIDQRCHAGRRIHRSWNCQFC